MKPDPVRQLSERYSREAEAYRELWAPILLPLAERGLYALDQAPARTILEIGTGVGTLLPLIRSRYPDALVLGLDRSPGMLALAPRTVATAVMDAMHLAVPSRSADLVLMNFVLFHLIDPLSGLVEANRVLKTGGRLVTVTWSADLESAATRIWDEELDRHGAPPLDLKNGLTLHELVDSPEKMRSLFARAGFDPIRAWQEPCEHRIDAEHLIRLRTSLGRARPRYEGLENKSQESLLNRIRERFGVLSADGFLARGRVVYALGAKP